MNWLSRLSFILLCLFLTAAAPIEFRSHRNLNYLEFLGLHPSFSPSDLKSAFRKMMLKVHPDRGGSLEDAQFVSEAYQVLKDDQLRKSFFQWLKAHPSPSPTPPQKTAEELHRENFTRMAEEVFKMAAECFRTNTSQTVNDMSQRASALILFQARFFSGRVLGTPDLAELMENFVLSNSLRANSNQRFVLALGIIDLLRRQAPYGYEEGEEARTYLSRLTGQLELDIRRGSDHNQRLLFDRIFERLAGRSILRASPLPQPPPSISACEAALRYQEAAGLGGQIPARVDIRF